MTGRPRGRKRAPSSPRDEPSEDSGTHSGKEPPVASSDDRYERPGGDEGEAVGAHAEFVARHFGGGAEATPELLDRAMEVWQRLPGAVVRGPAQIRPNRPAPPAGSRDEGATS
jgi:hypothetical protein